MTRTIDRLISGGKYYEGLRWHDGRWYASDALRGIVFAIDESGRREDLLQTDALCSGLGWLPDGSLLFVSMLDRTLQRRSPDGEVSLHADLASLSPHWINDMLVDDVGRAWVGTIGFAIQDGADPEPGELFRVDPDGTVAVAADDLWCPNGVVMPDERTLVVAESFMGRMTAFTVGDDGSLSDRRVFAQFGEAPEPAGAVEMLTGLDCAPDGLALDSAGHVWAADAARQRCVRVSPDGEIVDEVKHPDGTNVYSCALGGSDGRSLLLAASQGVFEALAGVDGTAELLTTSVEVPA
ncbi:SMP-30/gluconolactonase/LRE family protein [Aeromicrobium sp. CTD01-1L150]|uniref:SMP-30/gluconolactonase/LRE family protein n=1 Tax=Aeromicrobium sp. CTD01-1L150 TaxID=3341830 RepID=UPI0035C08CD0